MFNAALNEQIMWMKSTNLFVHYHMDDRRSPPFFLRRIVNHKQRFKEEWQSH